MDYLDRLRRLAVNQTETGGDDGRAADVGATRLDPRVLALARVAALIAVGASGPSFAEETDAALSAGADPDDLVDVLVHVGPVVGMPRVVAAAPALALALGYDVDDVVD